MPVTTARIAALPMYDFPELTVAHDALWAALRKRLLEAGVAETPDELTRTLGHVETWCHPRLLLGQGCEYPLSRMRSSGIKRVATPRYRAAGCEGPTYRSAIIVRRNDPAESLEDLRGRRCVINEPDSNSGMNLLRAALAPLANGKPFFESVLVSGSHRRSVEQVVRGHADVAAVDCVSLAHMQRLYRESVANLRILDWTASSPSLPFITAQATSERDLCALRASLAATLTDPSLQSVREQLFLDGVDWAAADEFSQVLRLENAAVDLGYPVIG